MGAGLEEETGVTNTIDLLGGSYLVETLAHELERQAHEYFEAIDGHDGVIEAINYGYQMR